MTGSCGGEPAGSPPPVAIQVLIYGPAAYVYVCLHPVGSSCQYQLHSLDSFIANTSGTYTVKAVIVGAVGYHFKQWISNAGTFGNVSAVQTTFSSTSSGYVGFTVEVSGNHHWGGYVAAMTGNGSAPYMRVSWAQGTFQVPNPSWVGLPTCLSGPATETTSIWVGMGGWYVNTGAIWQAGVDLDMANECGQHQTYLRPWYDANPSAPVYLSSGQFVAHIGDWLRVTTWANGSQSSFQFYDLSTGRFFSGSVSGPPPDDSAEWITEEVGCPSLCQTMVSTPPFMFTNPAVIATCPNVACPGLASSFVLPLEAIDLYNSNYVGGGTWLSQYVTPSPIASNMTAFTETYSP